MLHHPALYLTRDNVVSGTGVKSNSAHKRGDFLGFYTGRIVPLALAPDDTDTSFEIVETDCTVVRCDDNDIIGFVNEPPFGTRANAVAIPIHLSEGNAVAYYASTRIEPHTEIWVHYGDVYARDYTVGDEAYAPRRIQRADEVYAKPRCGHIFINTVHGDDPHEAA